MCQYLEKVLLSSHVSRKRRKNNRIYCGITLWIRKNIFSTCNRLKSQSENLIWLKIIIGIVKFMICVVHIPPESSSYSWLEDTWDISFSEVFQTVRGNEL